MKVCCGSGKPYDTLTDFERLGGCGNDHCVGPIDVEEFDLLLTGLATFSTQDCISVDDLNLLSAQDYSWEKWVGSQIEQEGFEKYRAWYDRMNARGGLDSGLVEAHNKLFGDKK